MISFSEGPKKINNDFEVIQDRVLGKGSFATVYLAKRRNQTHTSANNQHQEYVALKCISIRNLLQRRRQRFEQQPEEGEKENVPSVKQEDEDDTRALFFSSSSILPSPSTGKQSKHSMFSVEREKDDEYKAVMRMLQREISVHLSVSSFKGHENIVSMLHTFHDASFMVMVLEYCPLGDLHCYLKRIRDSKKEAATIKNCDTNHLLISEDEARHALLHLLRGLAFLHSRGIVHRDVKAGNIFLLPKKTHDKNNDAINQESYFPSLLECTLKLGDFGLAVQMSYNDDWDDAQHTICGTPSCLAPEVALSTPYKNEKSTHGNKKQNLEREKSISISKSKQDKDLTSSLQQLGDDDDDDSNLSLLKTSFEGTLKATENEINDTIMRKIDSDIHDDENLDPALTSINLLNHLSECKGHGQPADLWSAGCLFYAMLIGKYPFSATPGSVAVTKELPDGTKLPPPQQIRQSSKREKVRETLAKVVKGEWKIPNDVNLSDEASQLLRQLLSFDPKERGFARGILSQHAFFRKKKFVTKIDLKESPSVDCKDPRKLRNNLQKSYLQSSSVKNETHLYFGNNIVTTQRYNKTSSSCEHDMSSQFKDDEYLDRKQAPIIERQKNYQLNASNNNALFQRIQSTLNSRSTDTNVKEHTTSVKANNTAFTESNILLVSTKKSDCQPRISIDLPDQKLSNTKNLLHPIANIHRLPVMKHQWKEVRRKSKQNTDYTKKRHFTAYILPNKIGLLIKCEEETSRGAWIHVTGDGRKVCFGRLSTSFYRNPAKNANLKENQSTILEEAFNHTPLFSHNIKMETSNNEQNDFYSENRYMSSFCTDTTTTSYFSNTSLSARSLPHMKTSQMKNPRYHPLSCLFVEKNAPILSIYRKLEKMVKQVQKHTPKVTLYVYAKQEKHGMDAHPLSYSDVGGLLCKTLLMENETSIEVLFVDGVFICFETSTGVASVARPNCKKEDAIKINLQIDNLIPIGQTKRIQLPKEIEEFNIHVQLAQSSIELIKSQEKSHSGHTQQNGITNSKSSESNFPFTKRFIATGKHHTEWVDVTKGGTKSLSQKEGRKTTENCDSNPMDVKAFLFGEGTILSSLGTI